MARTIVITKIIRRTFVHFNSRSCAILCFRRRRTEIERNELLIPQRRGIVEIVGDYRHFFITTRLEIEDRNHHVSDESQKDGLAKMDLPGYGILEESHNVGGRV